MVCNLLKSEDKMDIALIKQRSRLDELLQIHPELRFMRGGRAGRIRYKNPTKYLYLL